jgi:hypothetical protein
MPALVQAPDMTDLEECSADEWRRLNAIIDREIFRDCSGSIPIPQHNPSSQHVNSATERDPHSESRSNVTYVTNPASCTIRRTHSIFIQQKETQSFLLFGIRVPKRGLKERGIVMPELFDLDVEDMPEAEIVPAGRDGNKSGWPSVTTGCGTWR